MEPTGSRRGWASNWNCRRYLRAGTAATATGRRRRRPQAPDTPAESWKPFRLRPKTKRTFVCFCFCFGIQFPAAVADWQSSYLNGAIVPSDEEGRLRARLYKKKLKSGGVRIRVVFIYTKQL